MRRRQLQLRRSRGHRKLVRRSLSQRKAREETEEKEEEKEKKRKPRQTRFPETTTRSHLVFFVRGGRARRASFRVTHERERELVFFMRYKPTSLLFFCFSRVFFSLLFFLNFLLVSFFSLSRVCSLTKANFYTSTKGGSEKRSKKPTFLRPFGLTAMISAHGYSVDVQKYDSRHIFRCLPNSTLRDLPPYLCAECP